jgi:hypothetical protein
MYTRRDLLKDKVNIKTTSYFQRHIALPTDHGSWVFLFSPMLIGLFAAKNWSVATLYLTIAALAAFLIRQPVTILIKATSRRRSKRDLPPALFWIGIYSFIGAVSILGLILLGFGYVLYLALPGLPVFAWHLYLVSRRAERRQAGVEIVGSGVLALSATAAYWVGMGYTDPIGWWLFFLTWFQSAASIVYAYLRLQQRDLDIKPDITIRLLMGKRALLYTSFNIVVVTILSLMNFLPPLVFIPYSIQWLETIFGTLNPAVHLKPTRIGVRQLIVSTIFTIAFIITWRI